MKNKCFLNDNVINLINEYSKCVSNLLNYGNSKEERIIRTKNITGDLGEYYVKEFFNSTRGLPKLKLKDNSNKGYDLEGVKEKNNLRIAVKTVTQRKTSCFRGEEKLFDFLIIVRLNNNYLPEQMLMCTYEQYQLQNKEHELMNGDDISLSKKNMSEFIEIYPNGDISKICTLLNINKK